MREPGDLLKLLEAAGSLPLRLRTILEWTRDTLAADGIALFVAEKGSHSPVKTRAALGSMEATAPLVAAELSRTGVPPAHGALALLDAADRDQVFFCIPVNVEDGGPWSAFVLQGPHVGETARSQEEHFLLAAAHLRDVMAAERASVSGSPEADRVQGAELLRGMSPLADGLGLPLYVCDLQGRLLSASPAWLQLTGYPSLEALAKTGEIFREPAKRAAELETVRKQGKVDSFLLSVTASGGAVRTVRDSAVLFGSSILGVFFDVTELLAANAELKEALQVHELLIDSVTAKEKLLQRTQAAAIRSIARLAEYKDQETGLHLQRICEYTRLIALQVHLRAPFKFRITMEYVNEISLSVMLHDIGKVSIPDHILQKPGKLDPDEWETMKTHTVRGWEVLHKADQELGTQSFLTLAASIALSHHERFDGKGYPKGTAGEQIHQSARIAAIADVYDALTSARPYKEAWSHERAEAEILGQAGTQFDPVLVEIMRDLSGQFADVRRRFAG
ncbi:MAG: HD domain-containing phosphohydrolase [Spirochaetia bacterium]